jgi:hypothetical protein
MRQFTIAAATVAIAALISAAPASAERLSGAPAKQNGQCWKSHSSAAEATWGTWQACPQPASAPSVAKPTTRRRT